MYSARFAMAAIALLGGSSAQADVSISNKSTQNMHCSGGVCTATAPRAILNAAELQTMLASGDVAVKSGSIAKNIEVDQPLSWTSTSRFTLDAFQSVTVKRLITASGSGAFTVSTNDGGADGDFYLVDKGSITFFDLGSSLIINGQSYILAGDLPTLAASMNANDGGSFALANDYNAEHDFYQHAPVNYFQGNFEGLGHTITHLKLRGGGHQSQGMFGIIEDGLVRDIYLKQVSISSRGKAHVGGLVGENEATIINASVDGKVASGYQFAAVGGLVGENGGLIARSRSSAEVVAKGSGAEAGGLVGFNSGPVDRSYATGPVTAGDAAGGLLGGTLFGPTNCYALGPVLGGEAAGGLAGEMDGNLHSAYSIGTVSGKVVGGFVGFYGGGNDFTDLHWDLDTSGVRDPAQGAGNFPNAPGITGLTDAQLKSGLPSGFDPKIWGSNLKTNSGYPYLLANAPQ